MPQLIKGIAQVQLDGHTWFALFGAGMNRLLNHQNVIADLPARDEASLIWGDQRVNDRL